MSFKVLFVSATAAEAEVLKRIKKIQVTAHGYLLNDLDIEVLVTGVGSISTAWEFHKWLSLNPKPDLAINAGIAGSYNPEFRPGEVVMPFCEYFADAGIEDGEKFLTLYEAGLASTDQDPFSAGMISGDPYYLAKMKGLLRQVRAITVNTATGSEKTREKLEGKFHPDIETMEGATFFYICTREKIPFLSVRAISNMVERRNRNNWDIPLALDQLAEKLNDVFYTLMGR